MPEKKTVSSVNPSTGKVEIAIVDDKKVKFFNGTSKEKNESDPEIKNVGRLDKKIKA